MSNARVNGRWVLDTVSTTVVAAGTFVRLMRAFFYSTTDNHVFNLNDANSKLICKGRLGTVNTVGNQISVNFGSEGTIVDGLSLSSISDGATLILYLGKL
jgi:hypothetical protein